MLSQQLLRQQYIFGNNAELLLNHYLTNGRQEGRVCDGKWTESKQSIVPIDQLQNRKKLQQRCTNAQFQAAYDEAVKIVTPLLGLPREEQMQGIYRALRAKVNSGNFSYSTSASHYDDPYGYLILGTASCAGCARATGLCLNVLGYSFEHVNENQWTHQWCRVDFGGAYWVCDPFAMCNQAELVPYEHPLFMM